MLDTFYLPSAIKFLGRNRSSFSDARINNVAIVDSLSWHSDTKMLTPIPLRDISGRRSVTLRRYRQKLPTLDNAEGELQRLG